MQVKKSRLDVQFKKKMAIRFLNYCGFEIDELSPEAWQCFKHIDASIYCIPLLKRDYEAGVEMGILMERYRMSWKQINRRIKTENWVGSSYSRTKPDKIL